MRNERKKVDQIELWTLCLTLCVCLFIFVFDVSVYAHKRNEQVTLVFKSINQSQKLVAALKENWSKINILLFVWKIFSSKCIAWCVMYCMVLIDTLLYSEVFSSTNCLLYFFSLCNRTATFLWTREESTRRQSILTWRPHPLRRCRFRWRRRRAVVREVASARLQLS